MFEIKVLDISAESRSKLAEKIRKQLVEAGAQFEFIPQATVEPLSIEELKFKKAPTFCVIGPEILSSHLELIEEIHASYNQAEIFGAADLSLSEIERAARFGVDDIFSISSLPKELVKRLIFLSRKDDRRSLGQLYLVMGAKGGVGVTSITAALGEALHEHEEEEVVLVDLDFETQDLARFMRARPFVSDALSTLLEKRAAALSDEVEELLVKIWSESEDLKLLPSPPPPIDKLASFQPSFDSLYELFQKLDKKNRILIIDAGCASGNLLEGLIRIADKIIFVVSNDATALFASIDKLKTVSSLASSSAEIFGLEVASRPGGLNSRDIKREFREYLKSQNFTWSEAKINWSLAASHWPGSGETIFSIAGQKIKKSLNTLVCELKPELSKVKKVSYISTKEKKDSKSKEWLLTCLSRSKKRLLALFEKDSQISNNQLTLTDSRETPQLQLSDKRDVDLTPSKLHSSTLKEVTKSKNEKLFREHTITDSSQYREIN
jgi:MinD-like ATPase involved in chromosome partitioning or flagellar assembly